MKKLATLLAVLLLLSCVPAAAAEETALTGVEAYQQYGPWYTWTQEQKDSAVADWSEEFWIDYWDAYFIQVYADDEQYYADLDAWNEAFYGPMPEEDWGDWNDYLGEEKALLGMPYPDGINVSVNGEWLTLDGVQPWAMDGRTMVPVRPFLEALGATVDYAGTVVTAKLANGDTLELTLGSTTLTRVSGDKIDKIEMDVPMVVLDNRTYIPARFAGEAVGMTVEWDDYYQAAYFTDWDSIAAQIDENFSILNTILALDGDRWDPEQTYRVKEMVSGSMTLYGETEAENGTAAMSLAVDGLVRGGQADLDMKLDLDLGELKELVTASMLEEDAAALDLLSNFEMEVRGDLGQGTLYMTGNKLGDIPGSTVGSGEWLALDLGQSIDVAALVEALEAAQSEPLTVGGLLAAGPRENGTGWYWAPPCTQVLDKAEKLALFLGDDCFTVSTSGSTTTYTLKVNTLGLADKLSALTEEDGTDELSLLLDYLKGDLKVDCSGTIKVRDNKLVDMDVRFTVKLPASVTASMPVDITFALSGNSTKAECTLTAKAAYGGKLELKAEASVEKTSGTPVTTPPEGAVVHTQDEYLDYGGEYLTDAAWGLMSAIR
ncbi:stalk domain-containing protein [uncultured Pseudoflavonifractor sp.]|uniref:stalk domain-containing protein n=1 Tax=uncultured Pseudoflavonifractor sp. TaxID=1221379 RepID=UPI0025E3CE67|nr:stalk domain-containing protein [uncultured Pseudoflavonifractor sp.]